MRLPGSSHVPRAAGFQQRTLPHEPSTVWAAPTPVQPSTVQFSARAAFPCVLDSVSPCAMCHVHFFFLTARSLSLLRCCSLNEHIVGQLDSGFLFSDPSLWRCPGSSSVPRAPCFQRRTLPRDPSTVRAVATQIFPHQHTGCNHKGEIAPLEFPPKCSDKHRYADTPTLFTSQKAPLPSCRCVRVRIVPGPVVLT